MGHLCELLCCVGKKHRVKVDYNIRIKLVEKEIFDHGLGG